MKPAIFDVPTEEEVLQYLTSSPVRDTAPPVESIPTEEEVLQYLTGGDRRSSQSQKPSGLQDFVKQVGDYISKLHSGVTRVEQFGPGSIANSKHKQGNALDFRIRKKDDGYEIAQTFLSNPQRWGISALIWDGKIWSERTRWKPKPYGGPHRHDDHVHVEWSGTNVPPGLAELAESKSMFDMARQVMQPPVKEPTANIFQKTQRAMSDIRAATKLTPEQSEALRTELKGHGARKNKLRQIIYSENTSDSRKQRAAEELARVELREAEIVERLQRGVPPRGEEKTRLEIEARRRHALRGEGATIDLDTALARLNSYWYAKTEGEMPKGVQGKTLKQVLQNPPPDFPTKDELETVRDYLYRASKRGRVAEFDLLLAFQQLEDLVRQRAMNARGFETSPRPLTGLLARAGGVEERLYESRAMDEEAWSRFLTAGSVLTAFAGGYGLGQMLAGRGLETLMFMVLADPAIATGFDIAKTGRAPTVEEIVKNFTYSESLGTKLMEEGEPFWKAMVLDILAGHAGGSLFTMARGGVKSLAKTHLNHLRTITGKPDLNIDIVADLVNDVHKHEMPRQRLPDGSVVYRSPSGSVVTHLPDGSIAERLPNETVIKTKPDGSVVLEVDAPREVPKYQPPREPETQGMKIWRLPKDGTYKVNGERLPVVHNLKEGLDAKLPKGKKFLVADTGRVYQSRGDKGVYRIKDVFVEPRDVYDSLVAQGRVSETKRLGADSGEPLNKVDAEQLRKEANFLVERAKPKQDELNELMQSIKNEYGLPDYIGRQKSADSLIKKVLRKQESDPAYSLLSPKDIVRGTVFVNDFSEAPAVIRSIQSKNNTAIGSMFPDEPLGDLGYRGVHLELDMGDGIKGEIQIHTRESWALKKQTDDIYQKWRDKDIESLDQSTHLMYKEEAAASYESWRSYWSGIDPEVISRTKSALTRRAPSWGQSIPRRPLRGIHVPEEASQTTMGVAPSKTTRPSSRSTNSGIIKSVPDDAPSSSKAPETLSKKRADEVDVPPETLRKNKESTTSDLPDSRDPMHVTPSGKGVIEAVSDLARKLDIPVSWKRVPGRGVQGIYRVNAKQIRIKSPWDIPTIAHEIGHHLDIEFNLLGPRESPTSAFDNELFSLGRATTPKGASDDVLRREGVANFLELFIRDPNAAQKAAPQFFAHYLKNTPLEAQSLIEAFAVAVKEFRADPQAIGQTFALPKSENVLEKFSKAYKMFRADAVDRFDPLRSAIRKLTGGRSLSKTSRLGRDNPEALLQNYQGIAKKIEHYLDVEQIDANGKSIGRGLNRILNDIGTNDYALFRNYWKAKHVLDLESKGIKTGAGLGDDPMSVAQRAIDDIKAKELDAKFDKAIDELRDYSYNLLRYAENRGMLPEGLADFLREKYPHYMPMNRLMEAGIDEEIVGLFAKAMRQKGLVGKKVLHEIKGSTRPTLDPVEQLAKNTIRIIQSSDSNEILLKMWKAQADGPGQFRLVNEAGENTIKIMDKGKPVYVQMAPDLYRAIQQMDDDAIHWTIKILSVPAQMVRVGAILAPEFMARNFVRDITAGYINAGMRPWKFVEGLVDMTIGGKKLLHEYYRVGGGYAVLTTQNYQELQKAALKGRLSDGSRVVTSRAAWNSIKKAVRSPITLLETFSRISEEATRVGFMKQRIQHYTKQGLSYEDALTQAVAEARDLIDYATRGARMRNINMLYEFLNAQIQGIDKAARSIKNDPYGFAKRVVIATAFPSLLEFVANKDKDEWLNRPGWVRNFSWSFELPDGTWIRIPKPFELGIPATIFGGFLEYVFMKNPHALEDVTKETAKQLVPGLERYFLPAFARPIVESVANKHFFFGGQIVPNSRKDLEPSLQYTKRTSEVAKAVGKMIDVSPAKLDHLVMGYFAGLGRLGLNIADSVYTGEPPKNVRDVYDLPGIRGFVVNPQGPRLAEVEKFYETVKEIESENKSIRDIARETGKSPTELLKERGFDLQRRDAYSTAYDFMRFLENEFYGASTRQEQKAIGNIMLKMAQEFNKEERNVISIAESILPGISRKMDLEEEKRKIERERINRQMRR